MRIIGAADEFWRLRLTRVDTVDAFNFEWHEDILYRQPIVEKVAEVELWHIEAIRLDDYEARVLLGSFETREGAERFYSQASESLAELTKSQFETQYMTPAAQEQSTPE